MFRGAADLEVGGDPERWTDRPDLDLIESTLLPLPPPAQPTPISARDLSADLVLDPEQTVDRAFSEVLTADLLDPGPDLPGEDTIQDQDAESLLGRGVVDHLLASVVATPPPHTEDARSRDDTEVVRSREVKPRQADIPTHIIRDRIEQNADADMEPMIPLAEPAPLFSNDAPFEGHAPPIEPPPPPPPAPMRPAPVVAARVGDPINEDSSLGDLVIPISDDELARSRRRRWSLVGIFAALPAVVVAAALVYLSGEEPATVAPLDARQPEATLSGARPPPPPGPDRLIEPVNGLDAGEPIETVAPGPIDAGLPDSAPVRVPVRPHPPRPPPPPPPPVAPPVEPPAVEPPAVEPPPVEPAITRVRVRALPEEAIIVVDEDYELENGGVVEVTDQPVHVVARAPGWEDKAETIEPGRKKDVLLLLRKAE